MIKYVRMCDLMRAYVWPYTYGRIALYVRMYKTMRSNVCESVFFILLYLGTRSA